MFYGCVMFPYPSGSGLHVGHWYNYALMDSYFRWMRFYRQEQVFQPFGYDAFGLPAENYARETGGDPREITEASMHNFRNEMERMNTLYEELLTTSHPSYQKWTQWLFTKLLEHNLAEKRYAPVQYCTSCQTVLANEQIFDKKCKRCEQSVVEKTLNQWFFKTTAYKDRLLKNLSWLDYPKSTLVQQEHWLENLQDWCVSRQRSWGCPIPVEGETDTLDTFVDSSFYFIRYCDANNEQELCSRDRVQQVDLYVGGGEHACMHLIYARFVNMFLYDIGVTPHEEPFKRVVHQGVITHDGRKMSKSAGNAVDPTKYDPDALRLYLMFLGPYQQGGDWSDRSIVGVERFLRRFSSWLGRSTEDGITIDTVSFAKKIDNWVSSFKLNNVVAGFMGMYKDNKQHVLSKRSSQELSELLASFAPGWRK